MFWERSETMFDGDVYLVCQKKNDKDRSILTVRLFVRYKIM
jgi:hypothetical protein